jgi:hypothetical protein
MMMKTKGKRQKDKRMIGDEESAYPSLNNRNGLTRTRPKKKEKQKEVTS